MNNSARVPHLILHKDVSIWSTKYGRILIKNMKDEAVKVAQEIKPDFITGHR